MIALNIRAATESTNAFVNIEAVIFRTEILVETVPCCTANGTSVLLEASSPCGVPESGPLSVVCTDKLQVLLFEQRPVGLDDVLLERILVEN